MGRPVKAETVVLWLWSHLLRLLVWRRLRRSPVESFRHNGHFSLNYYRELISAPFLAVACNSIRLALATTAVCD